MSHWHPLHWRLFLLITQAKYLWTWRLRTQAPDTRQSWRSLPLTVKGNKADGRVMETIPRLQTSLWETSTPVLCCTVATKPQGLLCSRNATKFLFNLTKAAAVVNGYSAGKDGFKRYLIQAEPHIFWRNITKTKSSSSWRWLKVVAIAFYPEFSMRTCVGNSGFKMQRTRVPLRLILMSRVLEFMLIKLSAGVTLWQW